MNNFYIAFAVYLNLIFIAAKLWDQITWSWMWVMTPLIVLTFVGLIATMGKSAKRRKSTSNIINNIQSIRDLIESTKSQGFTQGYLRALEGRLIFQRLTTFSQSETCFRTERTRL